MSKRRLDIGTLILSTVAGLSISGSFSALFSSVVPFSIFPLLALVLSAYCLHQRYLNVAMPEGMPMLSSSCFLLGLLFYSTLIRVEYPAIGSNFLAVRGAGVVDRRTHQETARSYRTGAG